MSPTRLFELPREAVPSSEWCQRWTGGRHTWRHRHQGGFDADRYHVTPIAESLARRYVIDNHYSASYPAAVKRWGLWEGHQLVGVAVLGVPMSTAALTNVFPGCAPFHESLELSRFVLADRVPANGETHFLGQVFKAAAADGIRGVVAFADPVPRVVDHQVLFPGHVGIIYQAANSTYLGRATPRTLTVLPDGQVLTARAVQKVRAGERGHRHVEARLVALGARTRRPSAPGAAWLADALNDIGAVRLRHPGNHRYAFRVGTTRRARGNVEIAASLPYPKHHVTPERYNQP